MGVVQATLMLFLIFFGLMFMGVPISVSIGFASISILFTGFDLDALAYIVAQRCFSGIDSFGLLALPFFMLAGSIMNKGGIARRLVRLARCFVGKIPGYLAATNVLTNMFFGAISGSSVAAASAVGKIMGPLEKQENYEDAYAAAINICSAPTGVIIPPSGPLILFSLTAGGASVKCFGGVVFPSFISALRMAHSLSSIVGSVVNSCFRFRISASTLRSTAFQPSSRISLPLAVNSSPAHSVVSIVSR